MITDKDCIFCKIVAGEIPSYKVYEDDLFLAFMDINPLTRGHCLLIPKDHHVTVFDMPEDLLKNLIVTAQALARKVMAGVEAKGINLLQSNFRAANQIIDHYHMHLIPRNREDEINLAAWEMKPGNPDEIAATAEAIKKMSS